MLKITWSHLYRNLSQNEIVFAGFNDNDEETAGMYIIIKALSYM